MSKQCKLLYIGNKLSVHGYTPTNIETLGPKLEAEGYQLSYASSKKGKLARLSDMCNAILKSKGKVDVVLIDTYSTSAFYFAYVCVLFCKKLGIPYIPILHGGDLPSRIKNSPKLSEKIFGHSYDNVVVSGYIKQSLDENNYKSTLIPNYIDLSMYPYKHRTETTPHLLWVRSFSTIYNPTLAVKVIKELSKQYPDIRLTMVGPDKDGSLQVCKDLAQQEGVADRITFTGRLSKEDWIKLSEQHSIFLNTTNFDNLPVSIIEAMALGMPIVSTNVGGVPFLIDDNVDGVLVPPKDKAAMVNAISSLLNEKEKVAGISKAARTKAEQFDWAVVSRAWDKLLSGICKQSVDAR